MSIVIDAGAVVIVVVVVVVVVVGSVVVIGGSVVVGASVVVTTTVVVGCSGSAGGLVRMTAKIESARERIVRNAIIALNMMRFPFWFWVLSKS